MVVRWRGKTFEIDYWAVERNHTNVKLIKLVVVVVMMIIMMMMMMMIMNETVMIRILKK